jgi:hypothetical protein
MGTASVQSPTPCRAPHGGAERNAPDLAGFRSRSGSPARPPAAGTRRELEPAPHPGVWDRLEEADQIEIGCSRAGFGHREGASPLSEPNAESSGYGLCDTL